MQEGGRRLTLKLDRIEAFRHSPAMRWLLLINLVAVVLLSGAVAIVMEGTRLDGGPSSQNAPSGQLASLSPEADSAAGTSPEPEEPGGMDEAPAERTAHLPDTFVPIPAPRSAVDEAGSNSGEGDLRAPRVLKVATEGAYPPFNYQETDGHPAGFDVDVARALCERLEAHCTFQVETWGDLRPALRDGTADLVVASMRIPETPRPGIVYSDPYYGLQGRFVGLSAGGWNFDGLVRQAGVRVAVQTGSAHAAYLAERYPDMALVLTQTPEEAFALVRSSTVEAAFADNTAALRWLKDEECCGTLGGAVRDEKYFGRGAGIALRAEDDALRQEINEALTAMIADGSLDALSRRYFGASIY